MQRLLLACRDLVWDRSCRRALITRTRLPPFALRDNASCSALPSDCVWASQGGRSWCAPAKDPCAPYSADSLACAKVADARGAPVCRFQVRGRRGREEEL